jgi:uncharacterized protein DUF4258
MRQITFTIDRDFRPKHSGVYTMSGHAMKRAFRRGLSREDVRMTLEHGQPVYDRGAVTFRIGFKVGALLRAQGIDADRLEGLQVIATPDHVVKTVYRNHSFRRPLKTRKPARRAPKTFFPGGTPARTPVTHSATTASS